MKHLVFTLLAALLVSGAASAQRLMVGVRGGVNFTDYSFVPTRIGDIRFSPGSPRAGYDVGFVPVLLPRPGGGFRIRRNKKRRSIPLCSFRVQ